MTPAPPYTPTAHPPPPPRRSPVIPLLIASIVCTQIVALVLLGICVEHLKTVNQKLIHLPTPSPRYTPFPSSMVVHFDNAQLPLPVNVQGIPTVRVGSVGQVVRVRNVDAPEVEVPPAEDENAGDVTLEEGQG